jgi:membrane protease YdiL (CAAX protease family)
VAESCELPTEIPALSPFRGIRLRSIIAALLLSLLFTVILFACLNRTLPFSDSAAQMLAFTVWLNGGLLGWCLWHARRRGISPRGFFPPLSSSFSWGRTCLVLIPVISANMGLMLLIFGVSISIAPDLMTQYFNSSTDLTNGAGSHYPVIYFGHMLAALLVVAPIVEEIFFRGFLLNMWIAKMGARAAVLLTAVIFAAAHLVQPGSFFLGLVAAVFYVETRNLLVPMVFHFLNNLIAVLVQALITSASGAEEMPSLSEIQVAVFILGLPMLIAGLVWLAFFLRRHFPARETNPPYQEPQLGE